jgi:hypothetical protein
MSVSIYTIHQAMFLDGHLSEVVVLCRDEPAPPVFFLRRDGHVYRSSD